MTNHRFDLTAEGLGPLDNGSSDEDPGVATLAWTEIDEIDPGITLAERRPSEIAGGEPRVQQTVRVRVTF